MGNRKGRLARNALGALGWLIGLGGVPDDLMTWSRWMSSIQPETYLRWAFVLGGTWLLYKANAKPIREWLSKKSPGWLARRIAPARGQLRRTICVGSLQADMTQFDDGPRDRIGFGAVFFNGGPLPVTVRIKATKAVYGADRILHFVDVEHIKDGDLIAPGEERHFAIYVRLAGDVAPEIRADLEKGSTKSIMLAPDLRIAVSDGTEEIDMPLPDGVNFRKGWRMGRVASAKGTARL